MPAENTARKNREAANPNAKGVLPKELPLAFVSVSPGIKPHDCIYNSAVSFSVYISVSS